MDRKLVNIKNEIEKSSKSFNEYFYLKINGSVKDFINRLKEKTNVFLFSGIIRDYFIGNKDNDFRDIDLVIEDDIFIENIIINKYSSCIKNSFGGYKIVIEDTIIDLWVVKDTWALHKQSKLGYVDELLKTTFFNFSSILFSFNNMRFIIGDDFLKFIHLKKIDIVYEENPFPELCIVNTIYYKQKIDCKISNKLKKYIKNNYIEVRDKLEIIQKKHFNEIKYSSTDIERILLKNNII